MKTVAASQAIIPSNVKKGFSLVEVLMAITLMGIAIMSLAGAATLGLSEMAKARQDLQYSTDVQQVADSLAGSGLNHVTAGAATVRGRPVSWAVTTLTPTSQRVDIIVQRRGLANVNAIYQDTVTLYLAKNQLQ
jgi:prepilin-type N-terminal cleavage/methylation domain-containing protein